MVHANDERVIAGGVDVTVSGEIVTAAAVTEVLSALVVDKVPARLTASDATLWGPAAESEAAIRLGWVDLPSSSRALLPQLAELRGQVRAEGLEHVVLAGMGGSSLAPEVIAATYGRPLTVLDTTDPLQVRRALGEDIAHTVVVVSSKSGGTIETDSHRRAFEQAFRDAGLTDEQLARRIVVVTDPGSPLERTARDAGYHVVLADPNVGGRYSALTAFGLVPTALAGVDVERLLDDAAALAPSLASDKDNPGLLLGAVLGAAANSGRDKLVLADGGSGIVGFGDWAEQLIAESTGKNGKGVLPVVVEGVTAPGYGDTAGPDALCVLLSTSEEEHPEADLRVAGPLGAQLLLWEYATAVAGRVIGIDPFNQPNVQESKDNTGALLDRSGDGPLPEGTPAFTDGAVAVYGDPGLLDGAEDLTGALRALIGHVGDAGYLAVMAYLDRIGEPEVAEVRPLLARALGDRQVTFGWGPRFLHSTGQYHKGGPQTGVFLQITGAVTEDSPVPGRPYTFGRLELAQALGDLDALASRGRPVLRLHLTDRAAGGGRLLAAARALTDGEPR